LHPKATRSECPHFRRQRILTHTRQVKREKPQRGRKIIAQGGADRRNPGKKRGSKSINPQRGDRAMSLSIISFSLSGLGEDMRSLRGATLHSACLSADRPVALIPFVVRNEMIHNSV